MALQKSRKFSYSDYLTWPEDERWELIDGVPYNMTPAPNTSHQILVGNFFRILSTVMQGRDCRPFVAPTDVVLSEHDVVQPDILAVCDKEKITDANIQGAPDLVVEVTSPSTGLKDKREKKDLYERYGVREFILVYPLLQFVERFFLGEDNRYGKGDVFGPTEILRLIALEGVEIPLWEVFEVDRTKEEQGDSEKSGG